MVEESLETKIWRVIFWIDFIVVLIMIIWYFVGGSPTFEQIILGTVLTLCIKNSVQISALKRDMHWMNREIKLRLDNIEKKL